MIHSLVHTSASKTLSGGSGFGVVAQTDNFPVHISRIVTNNSGYQFSKSKLCTNQDFSTVIFAHWSIPKEDGGQHVVTKISPCSTDQSGRPNRIAQHLIFDSEDMPRSGPASFATQFNWLENWDGEPRILDPILSMNESHDSIIEPKELTSEQLELSKLAALGRNSGVALHLPSYTNPLGIIVSIESNSDSATRWAMYWTINTQRKFMLPTHRLLISVANNPVEVEINTLALQHIFSGESKLVENTLQLIAPTPQPPDRTSTKLYKPPTLKKVDHPHYETENASKPEQTFSAEAPKETVTSSHYTSEGSSSRVEPSSSKFPSILALFITAIALFSFLFLIYKSSIKTEIVSPEPLKQEDSTP